MLESITLKFTSSEDIFLTCDSTTLFVGSNNSGKSLILREIERVFESGQFPQDLKLLKDFSIHWPSLDDMENLFKKSESVSGKSATAENVIIGSMKPGRGLVRVELSRESVLHMATNKSERSWFAHNVVRFGVLRLDGRSRFSLSDDQPMGDLLAPPTNVLAHLFLDDKARAEVRTIIKDAFGLYFTIDPTNSGQLRMRLSAAPPLSDEQSLNHDAREFHRAAVHIKEASDGVQAFTGIVTAVLSGEFHTILVDEPEAFLHPPLARKLGKHLNGIASKHGGTLVAATHSADFLMGCVQTGGPVQVVRLEYQNGKSKGRLVDPAKLNTFLRSPLMRSANVIGGLFHDGVVVTESDNDRAFYAEIYHRLSSYHGNYPSILFVNAQNKQTMRDIVGPLREFGIPAAAISDIDIVKDGGKDWTSWLGAMQIPNALHIGLGQQRSAIKHALNNTGKDMKSGGIGILVDDDLSAAYHFFNSLDQFGLFAVRGGELESWLPSLGVTGKKTDWTVGMLQAMGEDPTCPTFVTPSSGDVWDFMRGIVHWIQNPDRSGTP